LDTKGAVAPGFEADLVFLEDLETLKISKVFKAGKLVAEAGTCIGEIDGAEPFPTREKLMNSVRINKIREEDLQLAMGSHQKAHIIEVIPDQIVTKKLIEKVPIQNGVFSPDAEKDLAKLAVIERHHLTGNIGLGIVKGLGMTLGAVASTVGHDSHNLVVAGTNDGDIMKAVEVIQAIQGGLVVVQNGNVLATLELAISGLMSKKPYREVLNEIKNLHASLDHVTNGRLPHLFITLAFLSLPVIPELKLTDQGLFDVGEFKHIPVAE
jgi:adenine deaminase